MAVLFGVPQGSVLTEITGEKLIPCAHWTEYLVLALHAVVYKLVNLQSIVQNDSEEQDYGREEKKSSMSMTFVPKTYKQTIISASLHQFPLNS